MAYDALTESVELIESRFLTPVRRLSRRRRFAAMSVYVDGDVAVTAFARRGVGCIRYEIHVLALRKGQWSLLGGGGSTNDDGTLLDDRPARRPTNPEPGHTELRTVTSGVMIAVDGLGGVHDDGGRAGRWPWSGRWISYATVLASAEVQAVTIADRRLDVPWHGRVVVGWAGREPRQVAALDGRDRFAGTVQLAPPHR